MPTDISTPIIEPAIDRLALHTASVRGTAAPAALCVQLPCTFCFASEPVDTVPQHLTDATTSGADPTWLGAFWSAFADG